MRREGRRDGGYSNTVGPPSFYVEGVERGESGFAGKQLEAALRVADTTDAEHVDKGVKPVHQQAAK